MKKYIYSLIALFMISLCSAQLSISQAEYFWDTDPGAGNGTAVLAADGTFNSAFEQLSRTGIATPGTGLHKLSIRIKDNAGTWGPVFTNVIDVQQTAASSIMTITQAEYFWDTDPGSGNGTPVLATDGNFDGAFEQFAKTGIALPSAGLHVFNIRIKDNAGVWGPVFRNVINVEMGSSGCFQKIEGCSFHNFAVKTDGTLWAWGSSGHLGDGTNLDYNTPKQIGTASNWKTVTSSGQHSAGIKTDGTLWTWGYNNSGQLGNGSTGTGVFVPVKVGTASNWKSVAVGFEITVAIKTDGTLWAWGRNSYGGLGDGTLINKTVPTQVGTANNWSDVSVSNHVVALKTDGTLWTWGYNGNGQLGNGNTTNVSLPTQIGTAAWQKISAAQTYTLALQTNGTLWAFGNNQYGQLGDGSVTSRLVPTRIGTATNWKEIDTYQDHSLAIRTDGSLYAWGENSEGQLGDGTTTDRTTPTRIGTATDWASISAGNLHSIGLKTDGSLYSWGYNSNGQLGNGTSGFSANAYSPVSIACPVSLLDIEDSSAVAEIKVYPNPVSHLLHITFDTEMESITLFNLLGQQVMERTVSGNEASLDVSQLAKGPYIVRVTSNESTQTIKIIKQ